MELLKYLEILEPLARDREWSELIKVSEKAVEEFPYSTTLKTYRVRALMETGRIEDAKGLAFELLKSNPGSSVIHDLLAKVYEREGSYRKAVDEYMKILFLNPGDREVELQVERLKPLFELSDHGGEQPSLGQAEPDSSSLAEEEEGFLEDTQNELPLLDKEAREEAPVLDSWEETPKEGLSAAEVEGERALDSEGSQRGDQPLQTPALQWETPSAEEAHKSEAPVPELEFPPVQAEQTPENLLKSLNWERVTPEREEQVDQLPLFPEKPEAVPPPPVEFQEVTFPTEAPPEPLGKREEEEFSFFPLEQKAPTSQEVVPPPLLGPTPPEGSFEEQLQKSEEKSPLEEAEFAALSGELPKGEEAPEPFLTLPAQESQEAAPFQGSGGPLSVPPKWEELFNAPGQEGEEEEEEPPAEEIVAPVQELPSLYQTDTMAQLLEKQGRYLQAQRIFLVNYRETGNGESRRGAFRSGMKRYLRYLEHLSDRMGEEA